MTSDIPLIVSMSPSWSVIVIVAPCILFPFLILTISKLNDFPLLTEPKVLKSKLQSDVSSVLVAFFTMEVNNLFVAYIWNLEKDVSLNEYISNGVNSRLLS